MSRIGFPRSFKGFLGLLVLAALVESEAHGYEIMKRIEKLTGGFWRPTPGSLYPLLLSLEEEGLIISRVVKKNDRKLKIYKVTIEGLENFIAITSKLLTFQSAMFSTLSRIYCGLIRNYKGVVGVEEVEKALSNVKEKIKEALEECY